VELARPALVMVSPHAWGQAEDETEVVDTSEPRLHQVRLIQPQTQSSMARLGDAKRGSAALAARPSQTRIKSGGSILPNPSRRHDGRGVGCSLLVRVSRNFYISKTCNQLNMTALCQFCPPSSSWKI